MSDMSLCDVGHTDMSDLSVKRHAVISVIRNVIVIDRYVRFAPGGLSVVGFIIVGVIVLILHAREVERDGIKAV